MAALARPLLVWCALLMLATGCTRQVEGTATLPYQTDSPTSTGVDVDEIMVEQPRMQAITGAGVDLTIIPTMDGSVPVDIDALADTAPETCRFIFAETQTFGPDIEQFHKTTFQNPPDSGLISEGAAGYPDADTARRAFDRLVTRVAGCSSTSFGSRYVGQWTSDTGSLRTRAGRCGRDYLVKSVVLMEVTFCGFGESVPDIVMTNIAEQVPG
jgi:hypothetical protein